MLPLSTDRDGYYKGKKKGEIKTERMPEGYYMWVFEEEGVMASEKSPE